MSESILDNIPEKRPTALFQARGVDLELIRAVSAKKDKLGHTWKNIVEASLKAYLAASEKPKKG